MISFMQNTLDDQVRLNDLHKSTLWFVFQANWENWYNCMYQEMMKTFQALKQPPFWHDDVQLQQSHGHLVAVFSLWMKNRPVICRRHDWGDERWLLWSYFWVTQFQICWIAGIGTEIYGVSNMFPNDDLWIGFYTYTNCALIYNLHPKA